MKSCPTCRSQYTDDSLRFCLQDGTLLDDASAAQTVVLGEHETLVAARPTSPTAGFGPQNESPKRSLLLPLALVFFSIVLLAFVGVGIWILYTGGSPYSRTSPMLANANTDKPAAASKKPEAANKPAASPNSNANTPIDAAKVKSEVESRIDNWRTSLEAVDLDGFMSNYAESVDYYNGRGTTRAAVRDDKARAFAKFDEMTLTISNMKITTGPTDSRAVAVFDKEWEFSNSEGDRNAGKVSQQLTLEKINGKWLITLEKDLKVIIAPNQ